MSARVCSASDRELRWACHRSMSLALRDFHNISYSNSHRSRRKRLHLGAVDTQSLAEPGLRGLASEASYPSPPMSNPPSPSVSARSTTEVEIANPPFRTLTTVASPKASTAPYTLPAISSSLTSDPSQSPIQPWHNYTSSAADQPLSSPAPRGTASAADLATMEILSSAPRIAESRSAQALLSQNSLERSNISREQNVSRSRQTRRTKAHVASACVNCKKAHLSCDIQRPCTRCVATGKQVGP